MQHGLPKALGRPLAALVLATVGCVGGRARHLRHPPHAALRPPLPGRGVSAASNSANRIGPETCALSDERKSELPPAGAELLERPSVCCDDLVGWNDHGMEFG
jgi:hypothetical protein